MKQTKKIVCLYDNRVNFDGILNTAEVGNDPSDMIRVNMLIPKAPHYKMHIFTHLKLCLATATHNFKSLKITPICLICDQTFYLPIFNV